MHSEASVLIADDDINLGKAISLALRRRGYAVLSLSRLEAVEAVKEKPFNIVFVDLGTPATDGLDILRIIKRFNSGARVVIIAHATNDLTRQALGEEASGIICKPLEIEKVITLIEGTKNARKEKAVLVGGKS